MAPPHNIVVAFLPLKFTTVTIPVPRLYIQDHDLERLALLEGLEKS